MKPLRPIIVIILLVTLAIVLAIGPSPTGAYVFWAVFFPVMLARLYVSWYRRRSS
jgi:hypothetical protein